MGKFTAYKLPLNGITADSQTFEYDLDNEFFVNIDAPEVRKGKVKVIVTAVKKADVYQLDFDIDGTIQIPCDRCLDDMNHDVKTREHINIKLGKEYSEESEDTVIIPESENFINIAWYIYEFIALTIPIKHVHAPGKCNKAMTAQLKKHSARIADDEDSEMDAVEFDDYAEIDAEMLDDSDTDTATDPRWDALKKLKDNNK